MSFGIVGALFDALFLLSAFIAWYCIYQDAHHGPDGNGNVEAELFSSIIAGIIFLFLGAVFSSLPSAPPTYPFIDAVVFLVEFAVIFLVGIAIFVIGVRVIVPKEKQDTTAPVPEKEPDVTGILEHGREALDRFSENKLTLE